MTGRRVTPVPTGPAAAATTAAAAPARPPSTPRAAAGSGPAQSHAPKAAAQGRPLAPEVWYCPDDGGELVQDAWAMWCPLGQHAVPYSLILGHPESDEGF